MNLLRALFAFCVCFGFGFISSLKFRQKTLFFTIFNDFNLKVKNEVAFSKKTLIDIVVSIKTNNDFICCVKHYYENNEFNFNKNYLKEEDKKFLYDYLITVGQGDERSQLEYLNAVQNIIEEKRLNSIQEENKYKNLYIKLGLFIGLILFIILI